MELEIIDSIGESFELIRYGDLKPMGFDSGRFKRARCQAVPTVV